MYVAIIIAVNTANPSTSAKDCGSRSAHATAIDEAIEAFCKTAKTQHYQYYHHRRQPTDAFA